MDTQRTAELCNLPFSEGLMRGDWGVSDQYEPDYSRSKAPAQTLET